MTPDFAKRGLLITSTLVVALAAWWFHQDQKRRDEELQRANTHCAVVAKLRANTLGYWNTDMGCCVIEVVFENDQHGPSHLTCVDHWPGPSF